MKVDALQKLADGIHQELATPPDDLLSQCGNAALRVLRIRPDAALQLAKSELQNRPYQEVRGCWLRLYEESSLSSAAEQLLQVTERHDTDECSTVDAEIDWLSEVVKTLDIALIVSGAPGRRKVFEDVFTHLSRFEDHVSLQNMPDELSVEPPEPLQSNYQIAKVHAPSLEAFQLHIDNKHTPLLLSGVIDDWPAMTYWHRTAHLLQATLGGRRLVPIEIGETYTSEDWRQEIVPFRRYLQEFLLPLAPAEIGYLGQHNLFAQIPQLAREIRTPDYCFTAPPEFVPVSRTGLPPAQPVDEPQMNAWLGPKGTKTPLHTDPYHNIFCQVVGYKYVRLYPPKATDSLYPRGVDENGINESNTSSVEIRFNRERYENVRVDEPGNFPAFLAQQDYLESIIAPGECLYIPAGWWHFVESLTTSFSVSFWWN